jgi:Zn-dependent peptidase ImmA (M78 family)/transcriptional regulator with XRE-family HTH domain
VTRALAPIRPAVLRWARESAGMTIDEAARRVGITPARLEGAEAGGDPLTLNQARKAAEVYDRPFATLFLPDAPAEEPVEVQFRRFRDAPALPWPPAMRALARRVPAIQEEADDLFAAMDDEPSWPAIADFFRTTDDVSRLADRLREQVAVSLEDQKTAARVDPQGFRVFRVWREAIENTGLLVLQDGSLELDDMRGFASPHSRVPAIILNTNDDVRARLFTLLHELAHLFWLQADETRCDEFASAVLTPAQPFSSDFARLPGQTLLERVDAAARLYGVTPDAAAVRVGWLRLVPWPEVQEVREEIRERGGGRRSKGGDHYRNVVARMGPGFVTRVLGAVSEGTVSELAAARLLGVRVVGLPSLRKEVRGGA